jgi:hypothetical protein
VRSFSAETKIKAAIVTLVAVAVLALYVLGQDKGDDRPVIYAAPPPAATPIPPPVELPPAP